MLAILSNTAPDPVTQKMSIPSDWRVASITMALIAATPLLAGCGAEGLEAIAADEPETVRLSQLASAGLTGTFELAVHVDSDVNDPDAQYTANDSPEDAQPLAAPISLVGYVNAPSSGPGGRSNAHGDEADWFAVMLSGSESVLLEVAETAHADLELELYDGDGLPLAQSAGNAAVEFIPSRFVQEPGRYLLRVSVTTGASAYALYVGDNVSPFSQPRSSLPSVPGSGLIDVVMNSGAETFRTTAEFENGRGSFDFPALPAGIHSLFAGTDIDNDNIMCERGEACARQIIDDDSDSGHVSLMVEPFDSTMEVVAAAEFLLSLLSGRRAQAVFSFDDDSQRANWSNLPEGPVRRGGLRMGDLSDEEREAVYAVLAATLSPAGFRQVFETVTGDEVLRQEGGGRRTRFGELEYFFSILGTPSMAEPWMWQFGGHHLGINATVLGREIVLTPTLTGAEPVRYSLDGQEIQQLKAENDKSFALVNSFDPAQRDRAILGSRSINLVVGAGRDNRAGNLQPEGITYLEMTLGQQDMLLDLIGERVNILNREDAAFRMAEIRTNLPDTWFAWYGPTENGQGAYYRVHGPTLLIEYAPQGRRTADVNHIHAIYRDPTNDYASRLLN